MGKIKVSCEFSCELTVTYVNYSTNLVRVINKGNSNLRSNSMQLRKSTGNDTIQCHSLKAVVASNWVSCDLDNEIVGTFLGVLCLG